jgi:hypothetical protein
MTPLQVFHIALALLPWMIALFVRSPTILLAAIAVQTLVMIQWVVIGYCILNPIENNGSKNSHITESISEWIQLPIEEVNKGIALIQTAAPSFLQFSRLARLLGI